MNLEQKDIQFLLDLEFKMYWSNGKWVSVWEKNVKDKFQNMLSSYLDHFNEYCVGIAEGGKLIGAISLCRLNEIRSIPYLHDPLKYFNGNGEIAYVSVFVVKKGKDEGEIAEELYLNAEKRAIEKGCNKIVVVIYSSPIEVKVLRKFGYEVEIDDAEWEIAPDMKVRCNIWSKILSKKQ